MNFGSDMKMVECLFFKDRLLKRRYGVPVPSFCLRDNFISVFPIILKSSLGILVSNNSSDVRTAPSAAPYECLFRDISKTDS